MGFKNFIVVDGGEASGKTTLLQHLSDVYGERVRFTREPGGSAYAEEIRNLILKSPNAKQAEAATMFHLFLAARADHLKNTIVPALNDGKIVVCDRFDSSTYAYQIVAQGAKQLDELFWVTRPYVLKDGLYEPAVYVYLDIDPRVALLRKNNAECEKNHFDERNLKFHDDLRIGFKEFFKKKDLPINRMGGKTSEVIIIDASQEKKKVFEEFDQRVLKRFL